MRGVRKLHVLFRIPTFKKVSDAQASSALLYEYVSLLRDIWFAKPSLAHSSVQDLVDIYECR